MLSDISLVVTLLCYYGAKVAEGRAHGNLRLVGGSDYRTGRVEIFINTWGIVCDDSWDAVDARVVCRQLGFGNTGTAVLTYPSPVSPGTPIWLDDVNCNGHESRLIDCRHNGLENHDCALTEDAGVTCTGDFPRFPVRLTGGNTVGEGRVEIFHNNFWATVCDDGWDDTDATVVCRQLGLSSSGSAVSFAAFGQGTGTILLDEVSCTTSKSNIFECRHNGFKNHDCSHSEDAGVRCGDVPSNIVRLVGGSSYNEGRVEVNYNGEWGTVCDDGWDDTDAGVVCRQLGFGSSGRAIFLAGFGQGSGSIWLDSVTCTGNESTLASCGHLGVGVTRSCSHTEDAGVRCSGTQDASARLTGGTNEREGRVEIMYQGVWGTICDDGWDDIDASVVCRELGYSHGNATRRAQFESGTGPVWLRQVGCLGSENKLSHCIHTGAGNTLGCSHARDAGVQCSKVNVRLVDGPTKYEGRVEVNYNGVWGTVCDDLWDLNDAQVVCSELGLGKATAARPRAFYGSGSGQIWLDNVNCVGTEGTIGNCSHNGWGIEDCVHGEDASVNCTAVDPITNGTLRLVGSNSPHEGRLEVFINEQWARVCDDGWDETEAGVACRQLGFGSSGTIRHLQASGSEQVVPRNFSCSGNELMLSNCSHYGIGASDCNEDVEVECQAPVPALPIRLVDGDSPYSGRVEIYRNGVWGTVCDDNWTDMTAQVVCQQLGFGSSSASVDFDVPAGTGPILMDDIDCSNGQTNLLACSHNGFGNHNCFHMEDVGVTCLQPSSGPLIRLVGGSSYNEGRVEVYYNGEWGTVCDDGWDDTDAGVVCRQLGFGSSGTAIGSADFGQGSGSIWLDSVFCTGDEMTLGSCYHAGIGVIGLCSHNNDAGVRCFGVQDFSTRVQTLEEGHPRTGRIQILNNGQWGLVCANGWDTLDAIVVCQEKRLGNNGTVIKFPYNQTETLWLSGVDCVGNESQLSFCPHNGIGVVKDCEFVAGVECFVSPPIVTVAPNNYTANLFESVTFVCSAVGLGDFSFVWEHDGSVISASPSQASTLTQYPLSVGPVMPQHQGQYKCTVTSSYSNLSSDDAFAMLNLNAPSFDSPTVLRQLSSNPSANTITVTIPQIDVSGGLISHYYIVVSLEQLEDTEAVMESELLPADPVKRNAHLPLYVTASVNYEDFHQNFIIGDGSSSTDPITQTIFYNAPLQKQQEYYYFIRAYSEAHSTQYPFFGTSRISSAIVIAPEDSAITGASSSSSSTPVPAIAVVVGVVVLCIIIACVVFAVIMKRRKNRKQLAITRSNGNNMNNPTYSSDPRVPYPTKDIDDDTTPPGHEEHVYESICEKQKHQLEANNKAPLNIYYNASQKPSDDDDDDRLSIKSDDVKYDDTDGQCTPNIKESKAYYSKNGKPKPQPKPRHNKNPTATTAAAAAPVIHYDIPRNNTLCVDEGDYTTLDATHSNGGNVYQELMVQQPPPPGYSIPSNIPATSTTLESYMKPSS